MIIAKVSLNVCMEKYYVNVFFVIRRDVDVVDDQTQWQRAIEEEVQEER